MSVVAAIRSLLAQGFSVEQALTAAEAFETVAAPQRTARQDRNARYYAKRKASESRLKASEASEASYSDEGVLNKTPSRAGVARVEDNNITNILTGKEERKKDARTALDPLFDQFWSLYPNKVGKRQAEGAFAKAMKRVSFDELMAGLSVYAAKTDDRPWCNPATWLNQDRWADRPKTVVPFRSQPRPQEPRNAGMLARQQLKEMINGPHFNGGYEIEGDRGSNSGGASLFERLALPTSGRSGT